MTRLQVRALLRQLQLTQAGAARMLALDARTFRRYALGECPIPTAVVIVLRLMAAGKITVFDVVEARDKG